MREDGVWKIGVLHHHPQFAGPHETGWRSVSDAVPLVPFHFTPDGAGTPVPDGILGDEAEPRSLAARAQRLVDQGLVQNLLAAYGFYVDRRLWDDVGDLFAEDGVLQWGDDEWGGRAGIRLALETISPAGLRRGELFDHLQLMPIVDIAPDGATARVRSLELQSIAGPGRPDRWGVRVCDGEFRRTASGWRIVALRFRPRLLADHDRGWRDELPPRSALGTAYPQSRGPAIAFSHPVREATPPPVVRSEASLDDLRATLAVAEAFDGAENVACAYGYLLDEAQWDATADLFARDGWKELSFVGTYIGRERIRDSLVARYGRRPRRPTFLPIHQKTQPYVTAEPGGQRARVRLRMLQVNSGWDTEASTVTGVYEEQIVREDGVWRIHGMDLDYIVVTQWAGGWSAVTPDLGRKFAPTPEVIAAFDPAPDGPLRGLAFAPFPEIGPLGFHFANPVSGRAPAVHFDWSDGRFDPADGIPTTDMTRKAPHDR
ncbi:nuclear transport factor 2 family protein [Microbacterium elymi]|uniref:Nuclear transport factor 2 family protein n=1 Tax=Microbacterium elymi TaxID=2909587 RepID=A0ABY5NN75_9MICO|nr:nuclear transport factor 2 family protein [Microbacterium elymi]UUT36602.1 nuclear transport factor 2 family protein [Microbacterium elymi]